MTKKRPSALELLDDLGADVELLADPAATRSLAEGVRRELEGEIAISAHGEIEETIPPSTRAVPDLAGVLAFEPGVALSLSGYGYKAMLFHAGALLRLNDAGLLGHLERIASVSAGSIVNAVLGLHWRALDFEDDGRARNFDEEVIAPLRRLAGVTIDRENPVLAGIALLRGRAPTSLAEAYKVHLFGEATLQDLPDTPRVVLEATNVGSGVTWAFQKPSMGDWRVGHVPNPEVRLADAVAASSAWAPSHWPVILRLDDMEVIPGSGDDLERQPLPRSVALADGSMHDCLALEPVWRRYRSILISDGASPAVAVDSGSRRYAEPVIGLMWKVARLSELVLGQVRAVARRQVINSFASGLRSGAYWGLHSSIHSYGLADALPYGDEAVARFAEMPARFKRIEPVLQERLLNWGYAVSDAALRTHFDRSLPAPAGYPFPHAEQSAADSSAP